MPKFLQDALDAMKEEGFDQTLYESFLESPPEGLEPLEEIAEKNSAPE